MTKQENVFLLISASTMSTEVLRHLIQIGINVSGLAIACSSNKQSDRLAGIPIVHKAIPSTIQELSNKYQIPVYDVDGKNYDQLHQSLSESKPDIILCACFPYLIPEHIYKQAKFAGINIHPSLLPQYRGPQPLFWQLKHGLKRLGVSLHLISNKLDRGDIVAQTNFGFKNGSSEDEIYQIVARLGVELFHQYLNQLKQNTAEAMAQAMTQTEGSYFTSPGPEDFKLYPEWSAEHAFNFMRATAHWMQPYSIDIADSTVLLGSAISFDPDQTLDQPYRCTDDSITVQFNGGCLRARLLG